MNEIIDRLKNGEKKVVLGHLSEAVAKKFGLESCSRKIVMWDDRLSYIEKHKEDYENDEQYEAHVNSIPDIVNSPDYVGLNPNGTGIEFVKKIDDLSMVAIRINRQRNLVFRSLYPISETKLENRVNSGRWLPFSDIISIEANANHDEVVEKTIDEKIR